MTERGPASGLEYKRERNMKSEIGFALTCTVASLAESQALGRCQRQSEASTVCGRHPHPEARQRRPRHFGGVPGADGIGGVVSASGISAVR
ncbi:hypothetical protein P7K49_017399 [Saguinus oedipus]|uniref:Uncharacterized protein n=1 Tax=Saguinus oedipus TaxID=9490 RepID=A0ABQ9V2E3_SAGOE|nr:hypothetical protein P7K49_017399 [Saguinus oedipus]